MAVQKRVFLCGQWPCFKIIGSRIHRREAARCLCLSVVSFNITIPRAQSFVIIYLDLRFTNAFNLNSVLSRRNVEASCHTQNSLMHGATSSVFRDQQTPPFSAITVEMFTTVNDGSVIDAKARYWSKIAFFLPQSGEPSEYCHNVLFGVPKMVWLPDGEKVWRCDYSFPQNTRTWQTDGRTDGRTDAHYMAA